MYRQLPYPEEVAVLRNGVSFHPVATLETSGGTTVHIGVDDHCYVLYIQRHDDGRCYPTTHWFPEAVIALKNLPLNPDKAIKWR